MPTFTRTIRRRDHSFGPLLAGLMLLVLWLTGQAVMAQDAGQPAKDGDFQSGGPGSPPLVGGQPTPKPPIDGAQVGPGAGGPAVGPGRQPGPATQPVAGGPARQPGPATQPTAGGPGTTTPPPGGPAGPGPGAGGPVARGPGGTGAPPPVVAGADAGLPGVAAPHAPPPQLSAGKNMRVLRWTTFRKITAFPRGEGAQMISNVKIAADGSRIAFISRKGTFAISPDGKDLRQLSDKPASLMDISADGRTVAWYQPDDQAIIVGNADSGQTTRMPGGLKNITSMRLTADGSRLFVLSPEKGGIFMMPTDASDVRKVLATLDVCQLFGLDENGNFWRSFDISDDGSRLVGHLLANAFAVNGDGSGLHALTNYKTEGMLWSVRISGDGGTVAHFRQTPEDIAYVFSTWDGGNVREFRRPSEEQPISMHLSRYGRVAAVTRGARFVHADGRTYFDALEIGTNVWANPFNLTMTADMRRGCMQIDGPESTDQGRPNQLVIVDINPTDIATAPDLRQISVSPKFMLADGSTTVTATAQSAEKQLQTLGAVIFRDGERIKDINTYFAMNDTGANGDEKKEDGVFSTNAVSARTYSGKPAPPGPVILRVHAQRKDFGDLMVVDLEGLEIRQP